MKIIGFLPSKVLRSVSALLYINTGFPEFPLKMRFILVEYLPEMKHIKISHSLEWFTSEEGVNFW